MPLKKLKNTFCIVYPRYIKIFVDYGLPELPKAKNDRRDLINKLTLCITDLSLAMQEAINFDIYLDHEEVKAIFLLMDTVIRDCKEKIHGILVLHAREDLNIITLA